eukprot:COSAG02_NODE_11513_length_1707_cov_54.318832_1_plen_84_part_00
MGSANVALVATKLHFDRELTNGIISGIGDGRKTFHIIPPAFEFILSEQTATKAPSKISDAYTGENTPPKTEGGWVIVGFGRIA